MTPRLDELREPVVVGQFYLVPTVKGRWYDKVAVWPVIGPKHNDSQCLNFHEQHYHLDARFIHFDDESPWSSRQVFASPLTGPSRTNPDGLPQPVWRRRRCRRLTYPHLDDLRTAAAWHPTWLCHFGHWEGRQARRDERGWVCPHRSVSLAGHPADENGVITCPLHLLRIDSQTGVVLPAFAPAEPPHDGIDGKGGRFL